MRSTYAEIPVQRVSHTPRYFKVEIVQLYLTEDCNLRCRYCFVDKKPRRMSRETARKTMAFLRHRFVSGRSGQLKINFFGGEPFLEFERMQEIITLARRPIGYDSKEIRFYATTNGTLAGPTIEKIIRDSEMQLLLSLDGDESANSERPFLSGRSSYSQVIKNLPLFLSWASAVTARATFHPRAMNLVQQAQSILDLGVSNIMMYPVLETDWSLHESRLNDAYEEMSEWFVSEAERGRILPLQVFRDALGLIHRYRIEGTEMHRSCDVGQRLLSIDPDGNVMPCHRHIYRNEEFLGHVDSPTKISGERDIYTSLSTDRIQRCDGCPREVCGGGCRIAALELGRGLYGVSPNHCITVKALYRAANRAYERLSKNRRIFLDNTTCPDWGTSC